MESKTLSKNPKNNTISQKGMSMMELILGITLITILLSAGIVMLRPGEYLERGRDEKRLSDISSLERAISEYVIDQGQYPDTIDTLRESTDLPSSATGPLENAASGWIDADLSPYFQSLPLDPINDSTYHYFYQHNGFGFELNAVLERYTEHAANDNGNDSGVYEVGSDLTIL